MSKALHAVVLVAVLLAAGCGTSPSWDGSSPRALVAGLADQSSPAASGRYLAWTRGSTDGPVIVMKLGRVVLQSGREPPVAVTPANVLAASGGIDGQTLVVQLVRGGNSDLRLLDLGTRRLRMPPAGVDTQLWEWRGSISGRWLLFGRADFGSQRYAIVLADLRTGRQRILDTVRGHGAYGEPGQVSGRYAVWAGCPDNFCSIYRYDIHTGTKIWIPSLPHGPGACP